MPYGEDVGSTVRAVRRFLKADQGQDLTEYSLMVAAIAFAAVALFLSSGASVGTIWGSANNTLTAAASGPSSSGGSAPSGNGGCDHCGDGNGHDGHH